MMGRPPVIWFPEMDDELRRMRALGHGYVKCGERIGVAKGTVGRRVRHLGLPMWSVAGMGRPSPSLQAARQRVAALIEEMAQ